MLDIFMKSKIEPSGREPVSQFRFPPGLESGWRIAHAINDALKKAEAEKQLFESRIGDAVGRAAVTLGNGDDEYLEREALDTHHLNLFDAEIRDRSQYLVRLEQNIEHFKNLREMLLAAFPEIGQESLVVRER